MKPDGLTNEILKALNQTVDIVKKGVDKALDESAEEGMKRLKTNSPENKGYYKKGWAVKKSTGRERHSRYIYNKDYPSLTHLLEYGHATRNGGRTKAQKHIAPVEEYVIKEFEDKLEKNLK